MSQPHRSLAHYTVTTGHLRQSPRSEVSDDVIAALLPLLVPGEHPMPAPPGYRLRVTLAGTALAATVLTSGGAPLATVYACADQPALDAALHAVREQLTDREPALLPPAALVVLHPTIALDPGASDWLGDFERCLAWAWIGSVQ